MSVHMSATLGFGDDDEKERVVGGTGEGLGEHRSGGGSKAALYDRFRPTYSTGTLGMIRRCLAASTSTAAVGAVTPVRGGTAIAAAAVTAATSAAMASVASVAAPLVVELGAGTGKMTLPLLGELLRARRQEAKERAGSAESSQLRYVATEPVKAMRRVLRDKLRESSHPTGAWAVQDGMSHDLPGVVSGSVDLVVAAQAFHWCVSYETMEELRRVVRPGGLLALTWNNRDVRVPWVAAVDALVGQCYPPDVPRQQSGEWMECFIPPSEADSSSASSLLSSASASALCFLPVGVHRSCSLERGDEDAVIGRVLSTSVIASRPQSEKDSIAEQCRKILSDHDASALIERDGSLVLPYVTHTFFFQRCHGDDDAAQPDAATNTSAALRAAYSPEAQRARQLSLGLLDPQYDDDDDAGSTDTVDGSADNAGAVNHDRDRQERQLTPIPFASTAKSDGGLVWTALGIGV